MADYSFADTSGDPLDFLEGGQLRHSDVEDDGDLSVVGGGSGNDHAGTSARRAGGSMSTKSNTNGKDRNEVRKTSAHLARENRAEGGQAVRDLGLPSYASTRPNASPAFGKLSSATKSNAARVPGESLRAPSRPRGDGGLHVPNVSRSRSGSGSPGLLVMQEPSPDSKPQRRRLLDSPEPSAPRRTRNVPDVDLTNSCSPPAEDDVRPKSKRSTNSKASLSTGKPEPRRTIYNKPVPSTARSASASAVPTTARVGANRRGQPASHLWEETKVLSKAKRAEESVAPKENADDPGPKKGRPTRAAKEKAKERHTDWAQGKELVLEDDDIESTASSSPSSPPTKKRKPQTSTSAPSKKPLKSNHKDESEPVPDKHEQENSKLMGLLSSFKGRAQVKAKQEQDRFALEGPKVVPDGPMAQIRQAGGRGAMRLVPPNSGNAEAGPSTLGASGSFSRRSRAASVVSTSSSLTSLSSEDEDELMMDAPSDVRLCPYCSEVLPARQTKKLRRLFQRLDKHSVAAPTSSNPGARSISISQSSVVCALHRSESVLIPEGLRRGWPRTLDWERVSERVREKEDDMRQIIDNKDSVFWEFAKERAAEMGKHASRSARGQFDVFEKCQPGYFGEIGQLLFYQTLASLFLQQPDPILTNAVTDPLRPPDFIYWVLIPEVAVRLIQEDLALDYRAAFDMMNESRDFGLSVFGVEEGEQAGGALMAGWDVNATEAGDNDDTGITILRRKVEKKIKHRQTRNSRRSLDTGSAAKPNRTVSAIEVVPTSSITAREQRRRRARSPVAVAVSSQNSISSSSSKRKGEEAPLESDAPRKKPKPKPRLRPSSSLADIGSSAPQGGSSQEMHNDVHGLKLYSSPLRTEADAPARDDRAARDEFEMLTDGTPPSSQALAQGLEAKQAVEEEFDALEDWDFGA